MTTDKKVEVASVAAEAAVGAKTTDVKAPEKKETPAEGAEGAEGAEPAKSYRPEGLPAHLAGETDQETIDKLFKSVDGYRKDQAKAKGIPEKLEDYQIELPKELAEKVLQLGEDGKDPVFEAMRGVLHENGVPATAALAIAEKFYSVVAEKITAGGEAQSTEGIIDSDFKSFGGKDAAKPVVDAAEAWITGLKTKGRIDDDVASELQLLSTYGEGLKVVNAFRVLSGEKPIPVNLGTPQGGSAETEASLRTKMKDERYWKAGKKDPAFIAEVTQGFQKLYGEGEQA